VLSFFLATKCFGMAACLRDGPFVVVLLVAQRPTTFVEFSDIKESLNFAGEIKHGIESVPREMGV